jgi:glycosyltransferase involved in cell wall biosynthesis
MIENRNIICIASDWFYDPTSKHHVMRILSRRNHVVWVNYHGSRRPGLSWADARAALGQLRRVIHGPRRVADNITVVTPLVVPLPGSRTAAELNRRLLVRQIREVIGGLPPRPTQLWSFAPDVDYLCGQFGEELIVYYCVDDFAEFSGYDASAIRAAESRLIDRADLVVTTSMTIYDAKRRMSQETILVPHGVDVDHFARATDPATTAADDLAGLPRPILGFWGLIQDWVDVDLLAAVATDRPDASVVLVGEPATDVSALRDRPNVHILGRRPYASLPSFARGFDVGLIPFRINALTRAANPIKLREYLAAGLPVVSTPLPEVARYRAWVELAATPRQFVAACRRVIENRSSTAARARQAAVQAETWQGKVEVICRHLDLPRASRRTRS